MKISKVMDILIKKYISQRQPTVRRSSQSKDPFKVLVACLLSLRTKDENTEKSSNKLFKVAQTPEEILAISTEKLEKLIYSSGYYKKKARTLKSVSKEIIERFSSKVPQTKEELLSIKGVGPKTANIVLCFAYNQCVLPIDIHCHRIPNRLGWVKTKSPEQTEEELEKVLPKKYWAEFNTVIILFGKSICTPISPFCSKCPIESYCPKLGVVRSR